MYIENAKLQYLNHSPSEAQEFANVLRRVNGQTKHHPFWSRGLNLDENQVNYILQYLNHRLISLKYFEQKQITSNLQKFVTIQSIVSRAVAQMCINTENSPWINNFSPNVCLRFCQLVLANEQVPISRPDFHWDSGNINGEVSREHRFSYWN